MRDLQNFINENIKFDSAESLISLFTTFQILTDLSQPQNIRRAAFLGYSTIAKLSYEKNIVNKTKKYFYIITFFIVEFEIRI